MMSRYVKVGELKFELIIPDDLEDMPVIEIENEVSMVFETMSVKEAIELRRLLDEFIFEVSDS
jgi:hypothetical protein